MMALGLGIGLGMMPTIPATSVPVNVVAPSLSGIATQGETLTCDPGSWSGLPSGYAYQWKRGATNIGTNSNTYVLVSADVAQSITCEVTATNAVGSSSPAVSNTVTPVGSGFGQLDGSDPNQSGQFAAL